MKKEIRIYMVHPFVKDAPSLQNYLKLHSVGKELPYTFVWDDIKPDYLIASEHIYKSLKAWNKFVGLYDKGKIHIYHSGECIAPDLNIFDYAIAFDRHLQYDDRVCRIPTRLFFGNLIFSKNNQMLRDLDAAESELKRKLSFCNFIYSNADAHPYRTELFYAISRYKQVDSLGKYLNNKIVPMKASSENGWRSVVEESIQVKRNYKFSIACENASYAGYTSEKLSSSLEAHTIPIYWGNRFIAEDFNEKAFINCHKLDSFEQIVDEIKRVDENDELWCEMISQPWMTPEQEERERREIKEYYAFWERIFMQTLDEAKRKGEGSNPKSYKTWFFEY